MELKLPPLEQLVMSDDEKKALVVLLANPTIQKYIALINWNAMADVMQNSVNTKEEEIAFLSRYRQYLGVQQVCTLIGSYSKKG